MKKAILSTTFLIAGTLGILAQGLVDFTNDDTAAWPDTQNRFVYEDFVGGKRVSHSDWKARLFQVGVPDPLGAAVNFYGTFPGYEGIYEGIFPNDGTKRVLVNAAQGVSVQLQVKIYDGQDRFLAESAPFEYTHKIPPAGQLPAFSDTLMVNFRAFAVPEPSTVALGVLGLGALLLFRRRK
jgi:hypothetical protein